MSFSRNLELAVVIPTFEERDNVAAVLERLAESLQDIQYEVIFVDDDSPDGTAERVRAIARHDPRVRVVQRLNRRGLASACLEGMLCTAAPFIAVMDADLQHDERMLPHMLDAIKSRSLDAVVGSRSRKAGRLGRALYSVICRCALSDPLSNFFLVRREFVMQASPRVSGIGSKILIDLLASSRRRPQVCEMPYALRDRLTGENKLNVLAGLECFQLLLDKAIGNVIPPSYVLFALVGSVGLAVYFYIFAVLLFSIRTSFEVAQISAAVVAMTVDFFLNNAITFRGVRLQGRGIVRGLASFYIACSAGIWINLKMAHAAGALGSEWYSATLLGLAVASLWDYTVTRRFTWRRGGKRLRLGSVVTVKSTQNPLTQSTVAPLAAVEASRSEASRLVTR